MRRRLVTVLAATVMSLAAVVTGPTPARAGTPTYYLALGDSLAAGTGAPSGAGYVDDVFAFEQATHPGLTLENLSCGGATTDTMVNGGGACSYTTGSQLGDAEAFIDARPGQITFVTIDIGGNDLAPCFFALPINPTCVKNALPAVQSNLTAILTGLRAAGGKVPIVGLEYYDPFLAYWLQGGSGQAAAKTSVKQLKIGNAGLKKIYTKNKVFVADGEKAFQISRWALKGTWMGQPVPVNVQQACNLTNMCTADDFHANAAGHALIATTMEAILTKKKV